MPPEDLMQALDRRPFVRFRIYVSDGTVYDIRHPELVLLGLRSAVIGIPASPDHRLYTRAETVALSHVVRLEPVEEAAVGSN